MEIDITFQKIPNNNFAFDMYIENTFIMKVPKDIKDRIEAIEFALHQQYLQQKCREMEDDIMEYTYNIAELSKALRYTHHDKLYRLRTRFAVRLLETLQLYKRYSPECQGIIIVS